MAQTVSFTIGSDVSCSDGDCGTLKRVVVDPLAEKITHLVVEPRHREGLGRLVPVELASAGPDGVTLQCSTGEFERFDSAEQTQFVPGTSGYAHYGPEQVLSWPYYGLRVGQASGISGTAVPGTSQTVTYDTVPPGEVEIRRGEPVYATDGPIGHVHGLVMDPASHRVSHVLLAEGHLWGHKEVAIPVSAVTDVAAGIRLRISKAEVADLPPVEIDR
ncbi:MAG TPA: PRC-barrel domain-containing protein [Streptosporangiaceae bacterium]|nr:PRC-barrel domain-containing protein [Streptosporangiaceae bacterium]